jgi:3-dehydroquinate synthetase
VKRIETLGYPIVIDEDCRDHVRELVEQRDARRVVVLTDVNVADRAKQVASALRPSARVSVEPFALGERRKTLAGVEAVLHALARSGADRTTLVIGVGGGIASDLFGFACAIYMRDRRQDRRRFAGGKELGGRLSRSGRRILRPRFARNAAGARVARRLGGDR